MHCIIAHTIGTNHPLHITQLMLLIQLTFLPCILLIKLTNFIGTQQLLGVTHIILYRKPVVTETV
jgi:hypothetical protein